MPPIKDAVDPDLPRGSRLALHMSTASAPQGGGPTDLGRQRDDLSRYCDEGHAWTEVAS